MSIGAKRNGGNPKGARRDKDAYDTPEGTTRALLPVLEKLDWPSTVWECACGKGLMAHELIDAGYDVHASDIEPRGFGFKRDFLETDRAIGKSIITNPPFNLAEDFIIHALVMLGIEYVALVLPLTYWSAITRFDLFVKWPPAFWLPHTWRLDTSGQGNPTMNNAWCIWHPRALRGSGGATIIHPMKSNERFPGRYDDADTPSRIRRAPVPSRDRSDPVPRSSRRRAGK